jgi:cytochrome c553
MPDPEKPASTGRAALAAALLFFLAAGPALAQQPTERQLRRCSVCHGPQGNSQVPATPSLAGQPQLFIENQMVLIREGLRDFPEMRGVLDGMTDAEIVALAKYFSSQTPVRTAAGPADSAVFERGKALAEKTLCGTCHLPGYTGRQQIPRLAGQHEEFLLHAMKQFRDHPGPGRDTIMAASLYGLKDAELADLAHFFAHLQ